MRLGFDATALPHQPVGAGNYIIHLLRVLSSLASGDELVIFSYPHGQELIDLPESKNIQWEILSYKKPASRLLWEQAAFSNLVKKKNIDLLHSPHYTRPLSLPCRSVVTFHDMTFFLYPKMHTRAKRIFFPPAIRMSARRADAVIADSESTRRDAIRLLGLAPDKITTVALGVGENFHPIPDRQVLEAARQKYALPNHFILYVGVVEPRKNLPLLLEAYHSLFSGGCRTPLVIVGKMGWGYAGVLQSIAERGLKDWVLFTGYIPGEDLPIVYNLADLFVYPSLYEGFGFPPLEAMACATPVVTSASSSMAEHVGEAGLLVPPGDVNALAEAINLLLADATLRQKLAAAGIRQAAKFTWTRTAQETLQVYHRVLKPGHLT